MLLVRFFLSCSAIISCTHPLATPCGGGDVGTLIYKLDAGSSPHIWPALTGLMMSSIAYTSIPHSPQTAHSHLLQPRPPDSSCQQCQQMRPMITIDLDDLIAQLVPFVSLPLSKCLQHYDQGVVIVIIMWYQFRAYHRSCRAQIVID